MSLSQPKSWFAFLAVAAIGFLVFLPMAVVGIAKTHIPYFLTGLTGAGVAWLLAAGMGIYLASGVRMGRYREIHPQPWRDQVW